MNEKDIREQYQTILSLLQQKRLKEAHAQLEVFLWHSEEEHLHRRLEQAQTSYHYLLQYLLQGINDPERDKLYNRLLTETWDIADQTYLTLMDKASNSYYRQLHRKQSKEGSQTEMAKERKALEAFSDDLAICQLMPDHEQKEKELMRKHEEEAEKLCLLIWGNSGWNKEEAQEMENFLNADTLSSTDLCLVESAVMLSLLECFDIHKIEWLLNAYSHTNPLVSQRALVNLVIVLHRHPERVPLYPELMARLSLLNEDGKLGKQINHIYIQFLRCNETEKISKTMQEEILPGMMKTVREMKADFEDGGEEYSKSDWEEAVRQWGLEKGFQKMNQWNMEGADLYMSTFSQLKNYPFFQRPINWFRPFDLQHSDIIHLFSPKKHEENTALSLILNKGNFCDSDKYSLCYMMARIPDAQREMIFTQIIPQDTDMLNQLKNSSSDLDSLNRLENISIQYIHDLYRFFKLNRLRTEIFNPFQTDMALHRLPALREMLYKPEELKKVADFYFLNEHPAEALELYKLLTEDMHQNDADTFQKTGYCLQKEKRYQEAIDAYRKADVLKPEHLWTLRHLATCYRMNKNFATALTYYKKVETVEPENKNVLFYTGICLTEEGRYDEALQYFFKMDFLENDCIKAWRAIGWCSFICGKHEQAQKYYEKAIQLKPIFTDYLNAGHVAWTLNQLGKAVEYYRKAIECENKAIFLEAFHKDQPILTQKGIAEKDIPLVLDLM